MDEQTSLKKKPLIPPKIIKYIGIGVVVFGFITLLLAGYLAKQDRVQLIERTQTAERDSADDEEPTPEVYRENVTKVLKRSKSSMTTLAMEVGAFEDLLVNLPSEVEHSYYEVQNFLGRDKLHVEFTLGSKDNFSTVHAKIGEQCKEYLATYPAITRIYYSYFISESTLQHGYFTATGEIFDVVNLTPGEPKPLNTMLTAGSKEYDSVLEILSSYLTVDYEWELSTDSTQYALTVEIDMTDPNSSDANTIDVFDRIFFCIQNEFTLPVQLRIYNGTGIAVGGRIDPNDELFANFYTDKPFYQDISRAEYYLCNEWLFGDIDRSLTAMLENIV